MGESMKIKGLVLLSVFLLSTPVYAGSGGDKWILHKLRGEINPRLEETEKQIKNLKEENWKLSELLKSLENRVKQLETAR